MVEGGTFTLRQTAKSSLSKRAWLYLLDNGATHSILRSRAFGGYGNGARIEVEGAPLARTWSLLARPASTGDKKLALMHDPLAMGWANGDRIVAAPTRRGSSGTAEELTINAAPVTETGEACNAAPGTACNEVSVARVRAGVTVAGDPGLSQDLKAEFRVTSKTSEALMAAEVSGEAI